MKKNRQAAKSNRGKVAFVQFELSYFFICTEIENSNLFKFMGVNIYSCMRGVELVKCIIIQISTRSEMEKIPRLLYYQLSTYMYR